MTTDTPHTVEGLQAVIQEMDSQAQNCLEQIAAIARLALAAFETAEIHLNPDTVAHALGAIWGLACDNQNLINCTAGDAGAAHVDLRMVRRYQAHSAARLELETRALNRQANAPADCR